jgi:hypothetical protein
VFGFGLRALQALVVVGDSFMCASAIFPVRIGSSPVIAENEDIISVGEFYEKAAGGEVIFT